MKLADALKIVNKPSTTEAKSFDVFLACGFEPLHLDTFLNARLRLYFPNRTVKIYSGHYGDLMGNMKRAVQRKFDAVAIVIEWQDLDPRLGLRAVGSRTPKVLPDILSNVRTRVDLLLDSIRSIARKFPAILCLSTLPLPPISFHPAVHAGSFDWKLVESVVSFAAKTSEIPNVRLLNPLHIAKVSPLADRLDVKSELMTGFPYSLPHASIIAEQMAWLIRYPAPKKGLVTDLDDTLWRGILGDDGIQGVSWDLDNKSHSHALYQLLLDSLGEMGVLIGVASKNNPKLVEELFESRELLLKKDRIFPFEVNWGLKSESIARIIDIWNIGPDSIVFVDDSAMELDQVKSAYPEIECLKFPTNDEKKAWELLYHLRDLFGKQSINDEDSFRLESIKAAALHHERNLGEVAQPEDIIREAKAELKIRFLPDFNDSRAFELVNKTNQFNLNGRRYTFGEWQAQLEKQDHFLMTVAYIDKYGPLGKIAVIKGRRESSNVVIDTWVMSCRAFGRRIEYRCLDLLFKKTGADKILFDFQPTPRNEPLQEFFEPLLGEKPRGRFFITQKMFSENCPSLYHTIKEIDHDESS